MTMTPTQREAALRLADWLHASGVVNSEVKETIALLRELLAEPRGEPVAWFYRSISGAQFVHFYKNTPRFLADQDAAEQWPDAHSFTPLYTHPPQQRQPLTEVQITELAEQCGYDGAVPTVRLAFQGFKLDAFARAIERHYGIEEAHGAYDHREVAGVEVLPCAPTYTEQQIADACMAAEVPDSKCESVLLALRA